MQRRQFLVLSAASIGGVLVYSLDRRVSRLFAQEKSTQTLKIPLRFFTEEEALIVAAAAARIFPSDDSGPGAKEAGVVIYIDRQLAGPYGRDRFRYTQGPLTKTPRASLAFKARPRQRNLSRRPERTQRFRRCLPKSRTKTAADRELAFLCPAAENTIEGMFCDPVHGGNVDMVGWQLVGFPGPRMSNYDDMDKHFGEAFRPKPISLEQSIGEKFAPTEDEDPKS